MKITSEDKVECEPCVMGKQFVSRSREADDRSKVPLEFVHSDISGPVEPAAKDGFRYALNFVDDYSGSTFVYFLKQKSDAARGLEKFLADVAPYGKVQNLKIHLPADENVVKRLRTDNGGEFVSQDFENVLLKHNIRHEFSAPYSPHQNGTAERNWRTLFEAARCMLIESNLPKHLWTYAVMAASHIRNRMYCQRIQDTPYHLLTGKQPSIKLLHLFGSVSYMNVPIKKKLDARCKKGLFVGYDKYSPAYLIYFPETDSIAKSATVEFTEMFESDIHHPITSIQGDEKTVPEPPIFDQIQHIYGNAVEPVAQDLPNEPEGPEPEEIPFPQNDTLLPEETPEGPRRNPPRNRRRPKRYEDCCKLSSDIFCRVSCTTIPTSYT